MTPKNQYLTPKELLGIGNELAGKINNPAVRMIAQSFAIPLFVNAISAKFGLEDEPITKPENTTIDIECEVIEEPKYKSLERRTTSKGL